MSEHEYAVQRIEILEQTVRHLMMQLYEQSPPYIAENINRIGKAWDKALDELEATQPGAQAGAPEGDTK